MATSVHGTTVIVRRFVEPGGQTFFEIEEVHGYLSAEPVVLPTPGLPEQFTSLADVFTVTQERWNLPAEAFDNPHGGHLLEIDFEQALRHGRMDPLVPRMSREDVAHCLGAPDAVSALPEHRVCWFYGSVQLYFDVDGLMYLEIERGEADFTSLRFEGWFLGPESTRSDLEAELARRAIPFRVVSIFDAEAIEVGPPAPEPRFLCDFDADGVIHAVYWNMPVG
jgi:hypothetical protein